MGGSASEGPDARITQLECQLAQMEVGMSVRAVLTSVYICVHLQKKHTSKSAVGINRSFDFSVNKVFVCAVFTSVYVCTRACKHICGCCVHTC